MPYRNKTQDLYGTKIRYQPKNPGEVYSFYLQLVAESAKFTVEDAGPTLMYQVKGTGDYKYPVQFIGATAFNRGRQEYEKWEAQKTVGKAQREHKQCEVRAMSHVWMKIGPHSMVDFRLSYRGILRWIQSPGNVRLQVALVPQRRPETTRAPPPLHRLPPLLEPSLLLASR